LLKLNGAASELPLTNSGLDLKSRTTGKMSIIFVSNQTQSTGLFHFGSTVAKTNEIMLMESSGFRYKENLLLFMMSPFIDLLAIILKFVVTIVKSNEKESIINDIKATSIKLYQ
jgi:hypothetical protein